MSRTDVHAPWFAKLLDPLWRDHYREDHRHERGPCDIDRFDPRAPWSATRCHVDLVWRGRNVHCGCPLCTGRSELRAERRRDRHEARRAARKQLKEESWSRRW